MTTVIESGIQLLARLTDNSKKSLEGLESRLFPEGLQSKQTIEISGDPGSGKTLLLSKLIASCILPVDYNGFNVAVLLINTDHHFQIRKLVQIMTSILKMSPKTETMIDSEIEKIIDTSLKNLLMINCTNNYQFACNLYSLPSILSSNNKIAIIALDSISAFYWQDREDREMVEKDIRSMGSYVLNTLKTIHQSVFQFNVKTIFTKLVDYETKIRSLSQNAANPETTFGEVNHRIYLSKDINSTQGVCKVESVNGSRSINYETAQFGFNWLE